MHNVVGDAIRQSELSAFDQCALSASFERATRNKNWATYPQARGSLVHRILGKCLLAMVEMREGSIPVDAALAIMHECLRQHDVPADEVLNVPMHEVKDIYWIVKKWAHNTEWSIENLVAVEERLYAPVVYYGPDGEMVERTITGQIDALFVERADHAIVLDWKDTFSLPPVSEVSLKGYFQQRLYAFLVMIAYPSIQRVTLREFYVRYSEVREASISREELDDVRMEVTALVERYDRAFREKTFPPAPGHHCGFCLRPEACPIPINLRREGKIIDAVDAQRTARQLVVGAAVAKQARAALQAWSDANGPVPVRDAKGPRQFGYVASERVERPTRQALETALALGDVNVDKLYRKALTTRYVEHVPRKDRSTDEDAVIMAALEGALAEAQARAEGNG